MFPSKMQLFSLAALGAGAYVAISYVRSPSQAEVAVKNVAEDAFEKIGFNHKDFITIRTPIKRKLKIDVLKPPISEKKAKEPQNDAEDLSPINVPKQGDLKIGTEFQNLLANYNQRKGTAWIDTLTSSLGVENEIPVSELINLMHEVAATPSSFPQITRDAVAGVLVMIGKKGLKTHFQTLADQKGNIPFPYVKPPILSKELEPICIRLNSDEGLKLWIDNGRFNKKSVKVKQEAVLIHCFGLSADPALVKEAKILANEILQTNRIS